MSCLCYCDEDDCKNTAEDVELYDLSWDATASLARFIGNNGHICKECLDSVWLVDYPDLVIKDVIWGVIMNPDFREGKR